MSSIQRISMFYNAKPGIFEKAKALRQNMTKAEQIIWNELRNKKMLGLRFKPQHPIEIFITDFYCHSKKLVIEIDGEYHNNREQKEYDINRTAELERFGIKVLRFSNNEIMENLEMVILKIRNAIQTLPPTP